MNKYLNQNIKAIINITSFAKFKDPIFKGHIINHNKDVEGIKLIILIIIKLRSLIHERLLLNNYRLISI